MNDNITVKFVTTQTSLVLLDGSPVYVISTASDLDAAFDHVCEWWGSSLDCGTWCRADDVYDLQRWECFRANSGVMALSVGDV